MDGLRHPDGRLARLLPGLDELSPSYFALVMSTGILSVASFRLGLPVTAHALFALNIAFYVVLWTLFVLRLLYFPRAMMADIADHLRGPGFFTVVVATSVLGSQVLLLGGNLVLALVLWGLAILLWIGLTYAIFTILTVKRSKPPLERGINGGWLLAVVATQSVAVLGALLAAHVGQPWKLEMNFFALSMWLWGGMLYIWMMSLIFYRYAFFTFEPGDLSPPYWINMGAMAISTLAGSLLIINTPHATCRRRLPAKPQAPAPGTPTAATPGTRIRAPRTSRASPPHTCPAGTPPPNTTGRSAAESAGTRAATTPAPAASGSTRCPWPSRTP